MVAVEEVTTSRCLATEIIEKLVTVSLTWGPTSTLKPEFGQEPTMNQYLREPKEPP